MAPTNGKPRPVNAIDVEKKSNIIEKRRVIDQLPNVFNTDLLKKFFEGSADHLFQPEISEKISGFIGRVPAHANLTTDFYIDEPTDERREHQLDPSIISIDPNTDEITNVMFYDDLLDLLRFQGGITNNADRLFKTETYSWLPPINPDKLMNYTNYFWFPSGPNVIRFNEITDIENKLTSPDPVTIEGVELEDNMRILFTQDVNPLFNDRVFIVSGVGSSLSLETDSELNRSGWDDVIVGWDDVPWDGVDFEVTISVENQDYIVIERGSADNNAWSKRNRWYHRNELTQSQLSIALERQAVRPIIEFQKNIELYNHGTHGRNAVTVRDDITTDPSVQIAGQQSVTIDGIELRNGDTVLFTNAPSLQGLWDENGWDFESPDAFNSSALSSPHPQFGQDGFEWATGSYDPFFNISYSAPNGDISLTETAGNGVAITLNENFIDLGFNVGMVISMSGTTSNDGEYTILNIDTSGKIMTFVEGLVNPGDLTTGNVSFIKLSTVYKNRVFKIGGVGLPGGIYLTLVADGQNNDGSPANGDQLNVLLGVIHQNNEYYWSDAEDFWIEAQNKITTNQTPLFQLYDINGIRLQDPGEYPLSTFNGNKIFSYQISDNTQQALDSILDIPLVYNNFGEIIFENHNVTDVYKFNFPEEVISGYYFYKIIGTDGNIDVFNNGWNLKTEESRQVIYDTITNIEGNVLSLTTEPTDINSVKLFINGQEQFDSWIVSGKNIILNNGVIKQDLIKVQYYSSVNNADQAVYEVPINLSANPDNLDVDFISNSEFFAHFTSLIKNQPDLTGSPNNANNWRNTLQDRSLGEFILQHRSPMLKTLVLGSDRDIDYILSVRFVEREFSRFRNKFLRKIDEYNRDGTHNDTQPASEWIEDALSSINLGKIVDFPFSLSGMGTRVNNEPTYYPSSPSRLGIYSVYKPTIYSDTTYNPVRNVIQMHDGSIILAYGDFRDDVIIEFENNIYDTIPNAYKTENLPDFDWTAYVTTKYNNSDYSIAEFNRLLTPIIQRWSVFNDLDLASNNIYSPTDPFTWNYSKQGVPGYWRGIYKYVYDTDRPNTHPWEMFGFSQMPSWWEARYGVAPYNSSNMFLWNDMKTGRIADGARVGIHVRYARPDAPIPVNGSGGLLDPVALNLVYQPGIVDAKSDWVVGDHGPVETIFRRSEFWSFAIAQISYLMKPAKFIELGWDANAHNYAFINQQNRHWINNISRDRQNLSELTVHGEILEDGTTVLSDGIQQWITNYITFNGQSITDKFANVIRNIDVRLAHKMGGFINTNSTRVVADNFGVVPQEDVTTLLYNSPSIREELYSGVILERVGDGWAVHGYDALTPSFTMQIPIKSSRQLPIDVGTIRVLESTEYQDITKVVPYGTIFKDRQDVFDFLIGYGKHLETRGWLFDDFDFEKNDANDWRQSGKQFLFWSQGKWDVGSLITVSPSAEKIKFKSEHGVVSNVEQIINGVYSLLDRDGAVINPADTFVSRDSGVMTILPTNGRYIFSVRLFVSEYEHVITFSNNTIFNDLIYSPLLNLRQDRFKLFTTRAGGWSGKFDAPGYIITDNTLTPNFEKTVNDIRKYFSIEDNVDRNVLETSARRLIGFQTRDYFDGLRLNDDAQFQFYQGFIRQKGTRIVVDKLFRSDHAENAGNIEIFEEWALRLGEFGSVQDSTTIEFVLREEEWRATPQMIDFKSTTSSETPDSLFDDVIEMTSDDSRWITKPPVDGVVNFPHRVPTAEKRSKNAAYLYKTDMSVGGYVLDSEIAFHVETIDDRDAIFNRQKITLDAVDLAFGDLVWVNNIGTYYDINDPDNINDDSPLARFNHSFMVYRYTDTGLDYSIPVLPSDEGGTLLLSTTAHGFKNNQIVMIDGDSGVSPDINGSYVITLPSEVASDPFISLSALVDGMYILINGQQLDITCDLHAEVVDLINQSTTLLHIRAYSDNDSIVLVETEGNDIVLEVGSPATVQGVVGAVYTTNETVDINGVIITLTGTTIDDAVADINTASVTGITAINFGGAIRLVGDSVNISLAEGSGTALVDLGFIDASVYKSVLEELGFISGTYTDKSERGFVIQNTIKNDTNTGIHHGTLGVFTESRFVDITARDGAQINGTLGNITFGDGDIVYVDTRSDVNDIVPLWEVYKHDGATWNIATFDGVDRTQALRIDVDLFNQSLLFNNSDNVTDMNINIFDPAKGLFPSQITSELTYRIDYDPAKYTDGDEASFQIDPLESWDNANVGKAWWDLSTAEYTNYDQGSNRQRRNNWGKLIDGKTVDVYEWVKSPVPPLEWATYVETNTDAPTEGFNYKPSGVAYMADTSENPPYTQRTAINKTTNQEDIYYYFWVKNSETVPNVSNRVKSVAQISRSMTNPTFDGIPWIAPISPNTIIVSGVDQLLTLNNSVLQMNYNITVTDVNYHREWVLSRDGDEKDVPVDRFWNKMRDSIVGFDVNNDLVPDPALEESRKYGNFIRPRQTWFSNREDAINIHFVAINDILKNQCIVDERPNLFTNLNNISMTPIVYVSGIREVNMYDHRVGDNTERDSLVTNNIISVDQQVWVDGTPETSGFWKVYKYDGIDVISQQPIYTEVYSETYKVSDFWDIIDFYEDGIDDTIEIDLTVDNQSLLNVVVASTDGTVVKVLDANNDGSNIWALYRYDTANSWVLIAKESCTIQFKLDTITDINHGNIDTITALYGRDLALRDMIDAFRNDILTEFEQNQIFYVMLRYVFSEQVVIDWAFKTSYILAVGLNQAASQNPVLVNNSTQHIIDFINEAKPYHTKLRDFIANENFGLDVYTTNVTDFDKPVAVDAITGDTRVLDPSVQVDADIMADSSTPQHDWFTNYNTAPENVRHGTIQILFDRVSCESSGGWDNLFGWDSGVNENWDLSSFDLNETAADRIIRLYAPQPLNSADVAQNNVDPTKNITETKDVASLISGCNFKGTVVDGDGLVIDINDIDNYINGGPLLNPGAPINPDDIIVDGNLFIQPGVDSDHPEELVLSVIGESIRICTNTLETFIVVGADITGATYNNNETIIINGIEITLSSGVFPTDAITDINNAVATALSSSNIYNIVASFDGSMMKITSTVDNIVLEEGTGSALSALGFTASSTSQSAAGDPNIAFRLFLNNTNARISEDIKPFARTILDAPLGTSDTTISVISTKGMPESSMVIIGSYNNGIPQYEFIEYGGIVNNTLTNITRSAPINHLSGVVIVLDITKPQIAQWDAYRIDDAATTTLASDYKLGDVEMTLTNIVGLPKQKTSETLMKIPGVIWIDNERIEYYRRDGAVIKYIKRGTGGTSSGINNIYDINGDLVSNYSDVVVGDIIYPSGTSVIDGTNKQAIPGGYAWESASAGLQASLSTQAKFLKKGPGSC